MANDSWSTQSSKYETAGPAYTYSIARSTRKKVYTKCIYRKRGRENGGRAHLLAVLGVAHDLHGHGRRAAVLLLVAVAED